MTEKPLSEECPHCLHKWHGNKKCNIITEHSKSMIKYSGKRRSRCGCPFST
jgi:hypothetical protein